MSDNPVVEVRLLVTWTPHYSVELVPHGADPLVVRVETGHGPSFFAAFPFRGKAIEPGGLSEGAIALMAGAEARGGLLDALDEFASVVADKIVEAVAMAQERNRR